MKTSSKFRVIISFIAIVVTAFGLTSCNFADLMNSQNNGGGNVQQPEQPGNRPEEPGPEEPGGGEPRPEEPGPEEPRPEEPRPEEPRPEEPRPEDPGNSGGEGVPQTDLELLDISVKNSEVVLTIKNHGELALMSDILEVSCSGGGQKKDGSQGEIAFTTADVILQVAPGGKEDVQTGIQFDINDYSSLFMECSFNSSFDNTSHNNALGQSVK